MDRYYPPARKKKIPAGFWVLLGVCAVATVSLLAYLAYFLVNQPHEPTTERGLDREIYSEDDRYEYWRGFDATALAAVVCEVFPDADGCTLAEGADENFITMTVQTDMGELSPHFSLRSANMTFRGGFTGYDRAFVYTSRIYEDVENPAELAVYYGGHLEDRGGRVDGYLETDTDGDGKTEHVYLVSNLVDSWLEGGDGTDGELSACQGLLGRTVCVYLDAEDETLTVHSFCLPGSIGEVTDALWDNGMLHLVHEDGVQRLFVSESALSLRSYDGESALLRQLCARYATYLEDQGYTDVRMRLADVSSAPGQEILCCYSDGMDYTVAVYAAYYGRLQTLFRKEGAQGSVYLVNQNGSEYLLDYSQRLSESDYSLTYAYCLFRFDESNVRLVEDEDSLWVASDQGGGQAGSNFFTKVNAYLDRASVCYDPYGLTGYSLMEGSVEQDLGIVDTRYLHITNCSTNKVGVVTLQDDDSWLNLRSGPSTDYDPVLINPSDEDSLVKQVQGSLVTVIMPYNTGDRNNPIWAQIQITYQNRTMIGCSSQRYIRIEGIRHLEPGDQFTITVDNYDTALTWSSSDPNVASIDSESGTLTAHRAGLVLITVTNEAGLEDSCLIMID